MGEQPAVTIREFLISLGRFRFRSRVLTRPRSGGPPNGVLIPPFCPVPTPSVRPTAPGAAETVPVPRTGEHEGGGTAPPSRRTRPAAPSAEGAGGAGHRRGGILRA